MEETLREHLASCAAAFAAATGASGATIGKRALNDNTFFKRIIEDGEGFTIRTYDRVIEWFAENWPSEADWPADVPHPAAQLREAV